jgi:hypothetical protein
MKGVALHDSSRRRGPKKSKTDPLSQCLSGEFQRFVSLLSGLAVSRRGQRRGHRQFPQTRQRKLELM